MAIDRQSKLTNPGNHWEILGILLIVMVGFIAWGTAFILMITVK